MVNTGIWMESLRFELWGEGLFLVFGETMIHSCCASQRWHVRRGKENSPGQCFF